jgi:hypothetical protein
MATIVAFNTTIKRIVSEIEKFDKIEQESILAYLRAKRMQKQPASKLLLHKNHLVW